MEKEELEQQIHETNILVRKLIRMQKVTVGLRLLNLFLLIVVIGGFYLYIKPFVPTGVQNLIDRIYESQIANSNLFQPNTPAKSQ